MALHLLLFLYLKRLKINKIEFLKHTHTRYTLAPPSDRQTEINNRTEIFNYTIIMVIIIIIMWFGTNVIQYNVILVLFLHDDKV